MKKYLLLWGLLVISSAAQGQTRQVSPRPRVATPSRVKGVPTGAAALNLSPALSDVAPGGAFVVETAPIRPAMPPLVNPYSLPIAPASIRGVYPLEASYVKTTHLIFPARISYVDVGSAGVLADKADDIDNVLRIKANEKGFEQTTLSVVTEDGRFYNFLVDYNDHPRILSLNMAANAPLDAEQTRRLGIYAGSTLDVSRPGRVELSPDDFSALATKTGRKGRFIHDVGIQKMKMDFTLDGVYVRGKLMILQLSLENHSEIDFEVDFFKFFLKDKDVAKRMASQEIEVTPEYSHPAFGKTIVAHQSRVALALGFPLITYGQDKLLELQVYERGGGRHLRFEVGQETILRARKL
jgi:conjugative transposon TraN protein